MPSVDVLLLIRGLDRGGAERQLTNLAVSLHASGRRVVVATLYRGGDFAARLAQAQIPLISLEKQSRWNFLAPLWRYFALLRKIRPSVVYSFLSVSNVLSSLTRLILPSARVVWGVRASAMEFDAYGTFALTIYRLEGLLSGVPHSSIANSIRGRADAIARGFPAERIVVVANGIDTEEFRFDAAGRERIRAKWNLDSEVLVFGVVARFDPMKGHEDFLSAIAICKDQGLRAKFVCVGGGDNALRDQLVQDAIGRGIAGDVIFPEPEAEVAAVFSALDFAVSASRFGEGFSNSIAEAMACARPCIATDVGDSAQIVRDYGWIVGPAMPKEIAAAMQDASRIDPVARADLGARARKQIEECYSVQASVIGTTKVLGLE